MNGGLVLNTRTKELLAVIMGNSIFGLSFLFSKTALQMTIPSVMLAVRFTTAFLVLNLIVLVSKLVSGKNFLTFSLRGKPMRYVLLLALFQPIIYFVAESYGINYTSSAFAGTIIAVIPVAGIILDVIIMHTKVTIKQVICAIGSVIGVIVTTIGAENMKSSMTGTLLLLIAVLAGALFYVFSKKAGEYFNPLERTYVMFGSGSVVYVLLGLIQSRGDYEELIIKPLTSGTFWGCIIYLAIVSSVVAFLMLNFGSTYVSVSEATIFANLTTVISIVAGVLILHETFTIPQIVGAIVILISVYMASSGKNKE